MNQVHCRLVHSCALGQHRSRVVDQNPERHWNMLLVEGRNLLKFPVLVDLETAFAKIGHEIVLLVDHRSVKDHFLDLLPENELAPVSLD
jgi:hypothetical protein